MSKVITFTFQSGYVQMLKGLGFPQPLLTLHSNLVMFKFMLWQCSQRSLSLYIPIWLCSNGEQKTGAWCGFCTLHSNLVMFKLYFVTACYCLNILYIPIWLCSN